MEAYPPEYVEHNLPLVLLSGLGGEEATGKKTQSRQQESGAKFANESPVCQGERSRQLLHEFRGVDGSANAWNSASLPGPTGSIRYRIRAIGRTYTLPPRKAAPLPQSPDAGAGPLPRNSELHSPLSPLSPGSPIFPDGLFTPLWFSKHQQQVPCLLLLFFDLTAGEGASQDERIKNDINSTRNALTRSGFKTRLAVVMMGDKSILQAPELEDRLSAVRRATGLDPKSTLFFMPPMPSQAEMATFIQSLMMTLQPSLVEYYRDLTKHARRKKAKGGPSAQSNSQNAHASHLIPLSGWSVRYEVKQGVFAEFRQEMDLAERHYEAALEELFGEGGIFETTASWNVRWDQTRLISDAVALRILRCQLWTAQTVAATKSWMDYKARVRDLVDRRGKGSQTYSWDAWEARWAGVMAQMIRLANVPGLEKPERTENEQSTSELVASSVYAFPEKALSPLDRLAPFNFMHHSGYWLRLFAKGIRSRWEKALSLPEEDRVPPGQSPASTMVKRSKSYDTYLVCEPHDEFPLSGAGRYDYVSELSAICHSAAAEFEARGQTRMTEQMRLDLANDLVHAGRIDDATQLLLRLWEESTWRDESWHDLFHRVLSLLSDCISRDRSPENARVMPAIAWEMMSLKVSSEHINDFDMSRCLNDWEPTEKVLVALQDNQRLCPIAVSLAFDHRIGYVGGSIQFQLMLENKSVAASQQIQLSQIEICIDPLKVIKIRHKTGFPKETGSRYYLETMDLEHNEESETVAAADLTLIAGQTRVYTFSLTVRTAQLLRAAEIRLIFDTDKFLVTHCFTDENIPPCLSWCIAKNNDIKELLLQHTEPRTIKILPKPPKMQLALEHVHERYYTNELIELSVEVINEEDEAANATVVPAIFGQNGDVLSFTLETTDSGNTQWIIPSIESSSTLKTGLTFRAPVEASTYVLQIELKYTLTSDPDTMLSKTLTADLSFAVPFDAKFNFGPIHNPDPWPSYFDSRYEGTKDSPGGIAQRWSLGARVASLASQAVTIQKSQIVVNNVEADCACEIDMTTAEPEQTVQPHKRVLCPFEFTTCKYSLDDRRPSQLDLSLVLTWSRNGIRDATTTTIPVPRLTIPSSEPRVLCTMSDENHDGADAVIQYHLENPSGHFLTFALTMEANDDFAFSGPKYRTLSLAPLSRHHVEYHILLQSHVQWDPKDDGVWVSPVFHVIDSYYQKSLKVQPGGIGVKLNEKKEPTVFIGHRQTA